MTRYAGRKAVVIGGAVGIGLAVAKRLVEGGADVLLTVRDPADVTAVVPEVGPGTHILAVDPRDAAQIRALVETAAAVLRRIDHLIVAEDAPRAVCALLGLVGEGGSVVFTAHHPVGVRLAAELADRDIRVNTVTVGCLGGTESGPCESPEDAARGADPVAPLGRRGSADEVARAVLFLAVDATFTTGARLPVDGGLGPLAPDAGPGGATCTPVPIGQPQQTDKEKRHDGQHTW